MSANGWLSVTSIETVDLIETGTLHGHLDLHSALELCWPGALCLLYRVTRLASEKASCPLGPLLGGRNEQNRPYVQISTTRSQLMSEYIPKDWEASIRQVRHRFRL